MQAYPYPINMYNSGSGGLSPAIPSFDPPPNPWETQQSYGLKYDAITTKKLIAQYKMTPRSFNKEQVNIIKRHASSYNMPFAEDEQTFLDYVGGTVSQIVSGYLSGFTTINIGPAPQTGIESVARAIGSVAGFAGYLPGAPIKFAGKASGLKGIEDFGTALLAQSGKVKSVPMALTDMLLEKGKNFTDDIFKSASAVGKATSSAMSMVSNPKIANYLHRGLRMGLASGISSWQGGIDSMMKSFLWGASGGAADAFIGNVIKLPVKTQEMVLKGLAGALVDGLPSTLRGDTTPEQVYYYVRGAYFGSQELPWEKRMAAENFSKWTRSNMSMDEFKQSTRMPAEALREFDSMTEQYITNPMSQHGISEMLKSLGITEETMLGTALREKIENDSERSTGLPEILNGGDPGQAPTNSVELPHKRIVSIAKEFLHPFVNKTAPDLFEAKKSLTDDLSRKHYETLEQVNKVGAGRNAYTETMLKYIKDSYYSKTEMPKEIEGKLNAIARLEEQSYVSTHFLFNLTGVKGFGADYDAQDVKVMVANSQTPYSPTGKRIASKQMRTDIDEIVERSTGMPIVYADKVYTSSDNGRVAETDLIDIHGSRAYKKIIDSAWRDGYYWGTGINASSKEVLLPVHPFVKNMTEPQVKAVLDDLLISMKDSKFRNGVDDVYKDIDADTKLYSREQQMKAIVSNMIYETSLQYKFAESLDDVKAFFKWSNDANIVDTEKKRNKRQQIVYTTGARMSQEAFRDEDFNGKESYYERTGRMATVREVFVEDASGKFTGENRIPANSDPGLVETSTDGATIPHPIALKVAARWTGLDEQAGEMKVVGVHLDQENTGLKLIKTAMHNAGSKEMYDLMEKHGLTHITYITAGKQIGKAKPIKYADLFKDNIEDHVVTRPWDSVIINTGKNINSRHAMGKQTIVKQFFTQINPLLLPEEDRRFVADSLSNMLKGSISDVKAGDKKYNDLVTKFLASNDIEERVLLRQEIVENIDDVNKSLIYPLLSDKKAGSAAADLLLKLLDKEREEIKRDVDEGELTESDAARMLANVDKESSALEYFLTNMRDRPESVLRNPNTRDMALKTIKSYITRSIVRPKIANSGEFVVDPYISDAFPKGSPMGIIRDDPNGANMFILGKGAREMSLKLRDGTSITLGKLWDFVQASKAAGRQVPEEYNEMLRFVVLRTPQGSPSGARVLQFAGFDDNEGHLGIYAHPDAFSHLGGADTDIDVFKIYTGSMTTDASGKRVGFGFSKEIKDSVDKFKHFAYEGGMPKAVEQPSQTTYVNHSGGAVGSDSYWGTVGEDYGVLSKHYYYKSKTPNGNFEISQKDYEEGLVEYKRAAKELGRAETRKPEVLALMSRNWQQVKNSDAVFAVGDIVGKHVDGGTGYAVEMAKLHKKPIHVFDQLTKKWHMWDGTKFVVEDTPILTLNFAGIGTRKLSKEGKDAIADAYEKTFAHEGGIPKGSEQSTSPKQQEQAIIGGIKISVGKIQKTDRTPSGINEVMAQMDHETGEIKIDTSLVEGRFKNKAWTKPAKYSDGSETTPLDAGMFKTPAEMLAFIVEHEKMHLVIKQDKGVSQGAYEDKINAEASKTFRNNIDDANRLLSAQSTDNKLYNIDQPEQASDAPKKADEVPAVKIIPTKEQKVAIDEINKFIDSDDYDSYHVLEGKAGTGKTTIIRDVIDKIIDSGEGNIVVTALSHKATKVIYEPFEEYGGLVEGVTIAKLLGMKLEPETGKFKPVVNDSPFAPQPPIKTAKYIFVDEASMVNEDALSMIMTMKRRDAKVVFLGDTGQLPPIREGGNNADDISPVFKSKNKASKLLTRIRQGEASPILPYADFYWDNSHKKSPVSSPIPQSNRKNIITKKGALVFGGSYDDFSKSTVEMFKTAIKNRDFNHIKVVTYRNETRTRINNSIRKAVFGDRAKNKFNPGDLLMFNDSYTAESPLKEEGYEFENASEVSVRSVRIASKDYALSNKESNMYGFRDGKIDVYKIAVHVDGLEVEIDVPVNPSRWNEIVSEAFNTAKRMSSPRARGHAFSLAYNLKGQMANIDYAYAITSHKSQGSTYDVVVVDENDIMSVKPTSNASKSRSLYTAITRAKNVVAIISGDKGSKDVPDIMKLNNDISSAKGIAKQSTPVDNSVVSRPAEDIVPMVDKAPPLQPAVQNTKIYNIDQKEQIDPKTGKLYTDAWVKKDPYAESFKKPALMFNPNVRMAVQEANLSGRQVLGQVANMQTYIKELSNILDKNNGKLVFTEEAPDGSKLTYEYKLKDQASQIDAMRAAAAALNMTADITEYDGIKDPIYILKDIYDRAFDITVTGKYYDETRDGERKDSIKYRGGAIKRIAQTKNAEFDKNKALDRMYTDEEVQHMLQKSGDIFNGVDDSLIAVTRAELLGLKTKIKAIDEDSIPGIVKAYEDYEKANGDIKHVFRRGSTSVKRNEHVDMFINSKLYDEAHKLYAIHDVGTVYWTNDVYRTVVKTLGYKIYSEDQISKVKAREDEFKATGKGKPPYVSSEQMKAANNYVQRQAKFNIDFRTDLINEYARRAEPYILRDMHDIVSYKIVEEIYNRLPDSYPKSQVQKRVLEKVVDLFKYRIAEYAEVKEDSNKSMTAAKASLDEKYIELKNSLTLPIEQELFDAFIMSSMSYGGKGSREKNPDMKARFDNFGFFKGTSDTSINRMSIQLRSIPKEMFNRFNSVYDEIVVGKAAVADIGELYSGNKKLYTGDISNDAMALREIQKLQASLESPGERIHTPSITQAEIRDSIDRIIPSRIDTKLLDKYLTTPELQKRYEDEYRPAFDEFRKNIEMTGYTDIESINSLVRGLTGRAIDVSNIGKDINALTLADIKTINTIFSELKRPSTAIKLFGGKDIDNPVIRKLYYYLFPSEAGRDRQRFTLRFKDEAGYWVNKYGRLFEGTVKVPVNDIEQIAKHLHDADEFSKKAFEDSIIGFNNPLSRYTSLPDYKELNTIAIELREGKKYIATLMKRDDIPADRKKQLIDEYTASRKRALVSLREISRKTPLMEIKYRGANGEDVVEKKTPYSIVVDINNVMTNHLKGIYENLISAKPEAIYRFAKTKNGEPVFYYDYENKKYSNLPVIDRKKFYEYIDASVREGKGIPVDFGIDGLRLIQHSMLYDDMYGFGRPATEMHKKAATNMLMMASEDNGKIKTHAYEYDIYFPHIFSNREAYRKDMQAELSMIDKDDTLAPETKTRLKERLLKDYFRYGTNLQDELEHDTFLRNHDLIRETIESIKDKRQRESEELKYLSSMSKAGNQMSRSSFNLGYEKSLDSIERYTESIIKTYYRNMSQMLVRREIGKSRALNAKMFGEKAAGDWAKFQHLYAQAAAGYGVVIPDSFRDNPDLKIKGTLFDAYSDSNVHRIVNNLAAKFGIAKEKANIFGEVVSHAEIAAFSALEAKYAMASLLARPKNMVANMIGGELNNGISAGFNTLIRAQKVDDFREIHKDWDSIDKVRSTFTKWGIIEDMLVNELDNAKWAKSSNVKNFITDLSKKLTKDPDMSDKSVVDLARQHNVADLAFNSAAWFMRTAERKLRLDSAMVHYLHAVDNMRPVVGGNIHTIIKYDSPILIEAAKQGIKNTQFLYSAPFRPMFSASSLGKIMTRFQMYAFNSVDFRKNIFQKAKYVGYREGSPEFERMKRLMAADMISLAASSAFMYSVFDSNLPAPWNWIQDLSNWLFGDKKERDRAFFGVYPSAVAPLQMFTPPSLRLVGPTISGLVENDFSRIADYTIWTMFPFGPLTMDIKNSIENPNMMIEKMTGIPYHAVAQVIKTRTDVKTGQKIVKEDNEPDEGIETSKNISNVSRSPM